jgi:hypothetical protein
MYIRSTGLGNTRLRAYIERIAPEGESVVKKGNQLENNNEESLLRIAAKAVEPFHWDVEIVLEPEDVPSLIKVGLSRQMMKLFFTYLMMAFKKQSDREVM